MAISRSQKEATVDKLKNVLNDSKTIVFVNFHGITVDEAEKIRTACSEEDVKYVVARKKLIKIAFDDLKIEGEFPELDGEIAVAASEDILAAAQTIGTQSKGIDNVQIVGGVYEGSYISAEEMQEISNIPPLKVLYAQLLTVIRGPIQGYASVLGQIAEKKN